MREAEEVKGLRFPVAPASPVPVRVAAEFEETRLVGMQRQPESRETLAQFGEEAFRLLTMLESDDEIIRETHDDHVAARLRSTPPLDPEVKHVVQVHVGQQRTDAAALHRAHLTPCSLPVLQHSGPQPSLNEAHDAPVRHTVLEKADEPFMVQRIEEPLNVRVEHPVHSSRFDADRERVERLMRAALRPEAVREAEKVRLVDGVEHLDDGPLDDFVFQRGDAERPLPPVRLRDVRPPRWAWTVAPCC